MRKSQAGYTVLELIVVFMCLVILALLLFFARS